MGSVKPAFEAKAVLEKAPIDYKKKKIIVFDLDMTLTESRSPLDVEMSKLLEELLQYREIAVIGGGRYSQFQKQLTNPLKINEDRLKRLYIFPTCATTLYRFINGEWRQIYAENLTPEEKRRIFDAFDRAFEDTGYRHPPEYKKEWGAIIEDRDTQITWNAFGPDAPIPLKAEWDKDWKKRIKIKSALEKYLPESEFQITVAGSASTDVTRHGIDKAYGIRKISEILHHGIDEMLFIGDRLGEGGNDYPARVAGVDSIQVNSREETKQLIRQIINSVKG